MCSDIFSTFLLSSWSFLNRLLLEINQALVSGGGPLILQPLFSFRLVEIRKEFSVDLKRLSLWAASFRKTFRVIPVVWKGPSYGSPFSKGIERAHTRSFVSAPEVSAQ